MNVLLIEDDRIIADTTEQLLKIIDPAIQIVGRLQSVHSAIQWFRENPAPDLIFSDIELEDGKSFDIFKAVNPPCMIVFVTSFETYAIKAFKLNSVDYILKPVSKASLEVALAKFKNLTTLLKPESRFPNIEELINDIQSEKRKHRKYKSRFLVKKGQKLISIPTEEISYFFSDEGINYLNTTTNQKFIFDHTLDELEELLHPDLFFRINRSFYISVNSVQEISSYHGNRLLLSLSPVLDKEVLVSREKVNDFKLWLGK